MPYPMLRDEEIEALLSRYSKQGPPPAPFLAPPTARPEPLNFFGLPDPAQKPSLLNFFGVGTTPPRTPHAPILPPLAPNAPPTPAHHVPALLAQATTGAAAPLEPDAEKDEEISDLLGITRGEAFRNDLPPREAPEPFELAAEAEDRNNQIGKLEFMRTLAGNLGRIGQGLIGSGGGISPSDVEPVDLRGLDMTIGRAEDRMTPWERQMINESFGTSLPSGAELSRIQPLLPALSTVARNRQAILSEEARRQDTRQLAAERQEGINERAEKSRTFQREMEAQRYSRLSPAQVKDITALDAASSILDRIAEEKPSFDTGPVAARWHTAANFIGAADPKKAAFRAMVTTQFNDTLRRLTGAAVSPGEAQRVATEMPTMNDNDEAFTEKINKVRARLNELRSISLENLRRSGKEVSEFGSPATVPGARTTAVALGIGTGAENTQPAAGRIRVQEISSGRTGTIPENEFDESKYKRL